MPDSDQLTGSPSMLEQGGATGACRLWAFQNDVYYVFHLYEFRNLVVDRSDLMSCDHAGHAAAGSGEPQEPLVALLTSLELALQERADGLQALETSHYMADSLKADLVDDLEHQLHSKLAELVALVQGQAAQLRRVPPKQAGLSCAAARVTGFSLAEIRDEGYTMGEATAAGHTLHEMRESGYACAEAKAAGYSCAEVKAAGYSLIAMRTGGFELREIRAAGQRLPAHRRPDPFTGDLKAAGYACADVRTTGYTALEARGAGYTIHEARAAGFRPVECREAGFSYDEAKAGGYSWSEDVWRNNDVKW